MLDRSRPLPIPGQGQHPQTAHRSADDVTQEPCQRIHMRKNHASPLARELQSARTMPGHWHGPCYMQDACQVDASRLAPEATCHIPNFTTTASGWCQADSSDTWHTCCQGESRIRQLPHERIPHASILLCVNLPHERMWSDVPAGQFGHVGQYVQGAPNPSRRIFPGNIRGPLARKNKKTFVTTNPSPVKTVGQAATEQTS